MDSLRAVGELKEMSGVSKLTHQLEATSVPPLLRARHVRSIAVLLYAIERTGRPYIQDHTLDRGWRCTNHDDMSRRIPPLIARYCTHVGKDF
jgi:hypothetical protein